MAEKFGYGFSDIVDSDRDIDTVLRQTRTALDKAGINGPYVLCPHSMSGIEALYWAQQYPDEVESIVGLDMVFRKYQCYYLFPMVQVAQALMRKHGEVFLKNIFQNQIMPYSLNWNARIMYMIIRMKR